MDLETKKSPGGQPREEQQQQQHLLHRASVVCEDSSAVATKKYDGTITAQSENTALLATNTAGDDENEGVSPIRKRILKGVRDFCSDPRDGYWLIGARESRKRKRTLKAKTQLEIALEPASRKKSKKKIMNNHKKIEENRKQDEVFGARNDCEQPKRVKTIDANANAKDSETSPVTVVFSSNRKRKRLLKAEAQWEMERVLVFGKKSKKKTSGNEKVKSKSVAGGKENRKQDETFSARQQQQQPKKKRGHPRKHPPRTNAEQPPGRSKSGAKTAALLPCKLDLFLDAVRRAKDLLAVEPGHNYRSDDHDEDIMILV